jgi:hypothetical protein
MTAMLFGWANRMLQLADVATVTDNPTLMTAQGSEQVSEQHILPKNTSCKQKQT